MARKPSRWYRNQNYFSKANRLARAAYTRKWFNFAGGVAGGLGAAAAAGAANLFARVPKLDTRPDMVKRSWAMMARKRRRNVREDKGGYAQLTYDRARSGRFMSKYQKLSKLVYSHSFPVVDRFQNVTNLSSGAGAYYLNWDDSVSAYTGMPLYLMDLTGIPNQSASAAGTTQYPCPFTRMFRNNSQPGSIAGSYYTSVRNGVGPDGVGGFPQWFVEQDYIANANKHEKALIEWCDVRLVMYGARKCPSSIQVMVVQFLDDDITPAAFVTPGTVYRQENGRLTTATDPAYNKWNQAWQGFLDNTTGSVINIRDHSNNNLKLRVKFSRTFKFNPTMTTENDVSGHQIAFKFRYNMNKVCTYTENPQMHTDVTGIEELDPNEWSINNPGHSDLSPFPHNKGREFLLIKGYAGLAWSQYPTTGDPPTKDPDYNYAPSFDLIVRRKRSHMRG